ncbi:SDR family NAD(P)-dependent oxidoreductase, partial [Actinoplanes sp. NPDC049596]
MSNWFITGASRGLGLELVKQLLATGHDVTATTRSAERLIAATGEHERLLALEVDLADEQRVAAAVAQAGPIDVVVNNAG